MVDVRRQQHGLYMSLPAVGGRAVDVAFSIPADRLHLSLCLLVLMVFGMHSTSIAHFKCVWCVVLQTSSAELRHIAGLVLV